jgi:prolipoprotein diacylglyceryltransferase
MLDILVLPIMLFLYRRHPANGVVFWTWITLYGVTRSIAEIWREPGFTVLGLSGGQLVAIPQIFIGLGFLVWAIQKNARKPAIPITT